MSTAAPPPPPAPAAPKRPEEAGTGLAFFLLSVLVVVATPVVLLPALVIKWALAWRWPDRAVAALLATLGGAAVVVLLLATHYVAAWLAVGRWLLWEVNPWARVPVERPELAAWLLLAGAGLAAGTVFGSLRWAAVQAHRETDLYHGPKAKAERMKAEERRRRLVLHKAQRARHASRSPVVRAAARPWSVAAGDQLGPYLGIYQRGDLGGPRWTVHHRPEDRPWRAAGGVVRLPVGSSDVRHVVVLGASGLGKTETTLTLCEWAIRQGWQVCYLSAKEPPSPADAAAPRLVALAESLGKTSRVLAESTAPFDPMRGTRDEVRDKFVRIEEWGDRYWQHCANMLVALVLEMSAASGVDVRSLPELVYSLTRSRLRDLSANDPQVRELAEALEDRAIAGAMTRYGSLAIHLAGWVGGRGGWSWEDADVCVAELPTGRKPEAAAAMLRLLVRDFNGYLFDPQRRQMRPDGSRRPVLFVVEEAGQVSNDPVIGTEFVSLVERGRSAGAVAVVTAQDPGGLGDERISDALLTNGVTVSYRQNVGAEALAKLAGVRWHNEASATYDADGMGVAGSTRRQETFKFSPQYLRELGAGEAVLIARGRFVAFAAAMGAAGYVAPAPAAVPTAELVAAAEPELSAPAVAEPDGEDEKGVQDLHTPGDVSSDDQLDLPGFFGNASGKS